MLKNYFSIAWRNIRQSPLYAFINIFSLAVGLACCMVIYLFIADERSFDDWHSQKQNIYRLDEIQNFTGTNIQKVALSMPGMAPNVKAEFPEVTNYTRFWNGQKTLIQKDETKLLVDNVARVDSTFFDIFDYGVKIGDKNTFLDQPYNILLTEETSRKFFNSEEEAIGGLLKLWDHEYKVTGIIKNVPENSHLKFDALVSMTSITSEQPNFNDRWGSNFLNSYFILHPNVNVKALEEKFPSFLQKHMSGSPDIKERIIMFLQPLKDVHLASTDIEHDYNNYRKFNGKYLDVFALIGVFILVIAAVNFTNLTTARSSHRWKEIGVRKSIGARTLQLFSQFIFESTMLAMFALALAVLLNFLFVPLLNQLIGRQLSVFSFFAQPINLLLAITLAVGLGLLTGIYPAFYMTSFNMSRILKGGSKTDGKSIFRSTLVVVQFGLSLAMIVSTLIVLQQLSYMKNKDIGFNKDQMMLIDMNKEVNEKFETLKTELSKSRYVQGVTASGQRLGNNFHQWGFKVKTDTGVMNITPSNVNVEFDYLKVYGIKLKQGRSFSKENPRDNGYAFIFNESLAKELGIKNIIGTEVGHSWYKDDSLGAVIGVTEDFNFNSLHHKINTLSMVVHADWGYDELSVKIDGANVPAAIADVKHIFESNITSFPFTYSFLDEHFDVLYRSDQQMSAVVTIMAGLSILISCMGLFGLAAITTERKTKEIGIRKVLGATTSQITFLLSRNFTALIFVSFVLASPVTYWLLTTWLETFAYRVQISPVLFLLGGFVAMIIALATISFHTIRSANANPVNSLRYE
jgi:putative ABC transport system permease protein